MAEKTELDEMYDRALKVLARLSFIEDQVDEAKEHILYLIEDIELLKKGVLRDGRED